MFMDINYFRRVESTNDIAAQMAREGAPEGSVVLADEQTAGRGRFNRVWISEKGKGLWFSLVLRPRVETVRISQLTIVMSVAIVEVISDLYGITLGIKWPNDLLIKGKKLCGILSEGAITKGEVTYVIVGIGINVEPPETGGDQNNQAGYLEMATDEKVDKDKLLKELLKNIKKWYKIWQIEGFNPVRKAWLKNSVTIGEEVEVNDFREIFSGRAIDIDEEGNLVIEGINGEIRSFNSGEVSLAKSSPQK